MASPIPSGGRRQALNQRAYDAGWRGKSGGVAGAYKAYTQAAKTPQYERWSAAAAETSGRSRRAVRAMGSDFNRAYTKAAYPAKGRPFAETKRGPFHKLLVATGLREAAAGYKVGASPRMKGKR